MLSGSQPNTISGNIYVDICMEYLKFERQSIKSLDKLNNEIRRLILPSTVLSSLHNVKEGKHFLLSNYVIDGILGDFCFTSIQRFILPSL